jgi:hypothetical protein
MFIEEFNNIFGQKKTETAQMEEDEKNGLSNAFFSCWMFV